MSNPRSRGKSRNSPRLQPEPATRAVAQADIGFSLAIFFFALAVRLLYLFQIESIPLFYQLAGDGRGYDEWAQRIASGDWLGQGVFYQAPLYPYFLALLQSVLGHDLWSIRVIQIILGSVSCVLLYRVGTSLFSRPAGIAGGLILACYAPAIFFDGLIEKSILDLFLLCLLLVLLIRPIETNRWTRWVAMGAVLGLLALSRENALILTLVLLVWIGLQLTVEPVANRLRWMALFFAGLLLILLPVGFRNLTKGGEFRLTTSQFGANFFIGNNPSADGTYDSIRELIGELQFEGKDARRIAEKTLGRALTPGEVSGYWSTRALNYIRSQPGEWLGLLGKKWLMVWNAREVEDSDDFYIYQQWSPLLWLLGWINHFGILAPFAMVGLWSTRHQWRRLWLFYTMAFALAFSVTIFYVFGRYRFPIVPLLALFAGAGLVNFVALYNERAWRSLVAACGVFLSSALVVNWPIYGISGPGAGGYNNLSNAFFKVGKVGEAVEMAVKAIELRPDYGVAHFNLGNLYGAQGKFDLAQHHFEEAIRIYPNWAPAHNNLGQFLVDRGDLATGIQFFRKAIELDPTLSAAHFNLGLALAKQDRVDEAVAPLREAVRLAPDSAEAPYYLGSAYAALGRYEEAAKYFSEAVRIRYSFAEAHESLAQILSQQGKKELAIHHYEEALRLMRLQGDAPG